MFRTYLAKRRYAKALMKDAVVVGEHVIARADYEMYEAIREGASHLHFSGYPIGGGPIINTPGRTAGIGRVGDGETVERAHAMKNDPYGLTESDYRVLHKSGLIKILRTV